MTGYIFHISIPTLFLFLNEKLKLSKYSFQVEQIRSANGREITIRDVKMQTGAKNLVCWNLKRKKNFTGGIVVPFSSYLSFFGD